MSMTTDGAECPVDLHLVRCQSKKQNLVKQSSVAVTETSNETAYYKKPSCR